VVKNWLASISPKAVQPIVPLCPDHPDDRIGASVAGCNNRRACTAEAAAPRRAESRSLACADLQDGELILRCPRRAISPGTLQGDVQVCANLIDRWCGPDRPARNSFGGETTADAAKIVLIEQIASPVLAERQHQSLSICRSPGIQRNRIRSAEVGILLIQRKPVRRRKEVALLARSMQVRSKTEHRLTVPPRRDAESISRGYEQRLASDTDAARSPNAATACTRRPCGHSLRPLERNSNHPAVVIAAITEMTAKWHVQHAAKNSQRTTLILVTRIEGSRCV